MAARRNYHPTLLRFSHILLKFVTRYRAAIDAGLDPTQAAYISALVTALENILTSIPPNTGS